MPNNGPPFILSGKSSGVSLASPFPYIMYYNFSCILNINSYQQFHFTSPPQQLHIILRIILDFHFISFFSPSRELHESTGAHAPHLSSLMLRKYVVLGTCLQIPRPIYVYKYIHANVYTQSYCIQFG